MTTETAKKKKTPQILKTDTALKLAEKWVANMTRPAEDDPIQEVRPPRLGLGAKNSKQTKRRPSDDPLDQKLQAKFDAGRRKNARSVAESGGSSKNAGDDSEDDDESESKSQAFGKKRKNTSTPHHDDPLKTTDQTRRLGLIVCRGTAVMLVSPTDGTVEIVNPFVQPEAV